MKRYIVIQYRHDFQQWVLLRPDSLTLDDGLNYVKSLPLGDYEVIHDSWGDCLAEWPCPNYFKK